jgi:hypothetical protein
MNKCWLRLIACILLAAALSGCSGVTHSAPKSLAVLVNMTDSAVGNPRLARWKLERALSRVGQCAKQKSWNLEVVVVGGRDKLNRHYSARQIPSGKSLLLELESLRRLQLATPGKLEAPESGAEAPAADSIALHFGDYSDHAAALSLALDSCAGTEIAGVLIFTDGFDEDPDGGIGRKSFDDLEQGLTGFFAAAPARLLVFGPGPEIPEPADGRQMSEVWRKILGRACANGDGQALPGRSFVLLPDYLDFNPALLRDTQGETNGS